jgi:hypothetical protein
MKLPGRPGVHHGIHVFSCPSRAYLKRHATLFLRNRPAVELAWRHAAFYRLVAEGLVREFEELYGLEGTALPKHRLGLVEVSCSFAVNARR